MLPCFNENFKGMCAECVVSQEYLAVLYQSLHLRYVLIHNVNNIYYVHMGIIKNYLTEFVSYLVRQTSIAPVFLLGEQSLAGHQTRTTTLSLYY